MAGSAALTASFTLKLDDLLSPGLAALMKRIDALKKLVSTLGFDKLNDGTTQLRDVGRQAADLTRSIDGVSRSATSAADSVRQLGSRAGGDFAKIAREAAGAARQIGAIRRDGAAAFGVPAAVCSARARCRSSQAFKARRRV